LIHIKVFYYIYIEMSFSLHLYLGPMYAGKTTMLIKNIDDNTIVLDFIEENSCYFGHVVSHDNLEHKCIKLNRLCNLFIVNSINIIETFRNAKKILINEAQFFPDLLEFIKMIERYSVRVEVYGLDGDFERKPFGQILDIIPYCDSVVKLKGKCSYCNELSIFSKRITDNKEQYLVDETAYRPVCRQCYLP
jgi:thymidine kinase